MTSSIDSVEAAVEEARALQQSVGELTAALMLSSRRETSRWRLTTVLLVVVLVLGGWAGYSLADRIDRGVKCLNQEMADHRVDNRFSHEELTKGHDLTLPPAAGLPDPQPVEEIKRLCAPFYEGGSE